MSMPPTSESPNRRPPTPSARRGPRRRRSSTPGCSSWTRSHPPPASVLPETAARKVCLGGELTFRTPTRHRAPNRKPRRILIPGDGAAGDQGPQNRPACPAIAATRRLRPVPSQRLPALRSQVYKPSCNRQVTSTSIHMTEPRPQWPCVCGIDNI